MIDVYMDRFEHPYLLTLLPIAAVLLGLSAMVEAAGMGTWSGFLVLYAMVAVIICLIGYSAFFLLKASTRGLRWWRFRRYRTD